MRFGLFASVLFHLAIIGAAFLSLPPGWRPDVLPEPYIPLDLIREAELDLKTSVPAAAPEPVEEETPAPDLPEPAIEEEPAPAEEAPEPQALPEPEPEPAVEEPEPAPVKPESEPEKKPAPPKETPKVKPKPKRDELDLDALSKLIDKERENERAKTPSQTPSQTTEQADRARSAIGAGDRLTASVVQKMKSAVQPCWSVGSIIGAPEPEKLVVVLQFELNRDGTLASPPRVENSLQINLSGNQFWKVAEREAVSATNECAPYDFLPEDQYESWKEMRLVFNPAEMAGR